MKRSEPAQREDLRTHMLSALLSIREGLRGSDTKTSILLGIGSALLATVLTSLAAGTEKNFFVQGTVPFVFAMIGAVCLLAAVLLLLVAAMPRRLRRPGPAGWMQYANLTSSADVVAAVRRAHSDIDAQAHQIQLLSEIGLVKWRQVLLATVFLIAGVVLFFVSVAMRLVMPIS